MEQHLLYQIKVSTEGCTDALPSIHPPHSDSAFGPILLLRIAPVGQGRRLICIDISRVKNIVLKHPHPNPNTSKIKVSLNLLRHTKLHTKYIDEKYGIPAISCVVSRSRSYGAVTAVSRSFHFYLIY